MEVKIDNFQGPLSLLLQIIEKEELDINSISLAKIADEYLEYVKNSPDILPESMADFLLLAARLLYIKSKSLLPFLFSEEDEAEIQNLEEKLRLYKDFVDLSAKVQKIIGRKKFFFFRDNLKTKRHWSLMEDTFIQHQNLRLEELSSEFQKILNRIEVLEESLGRDVIMEEISIEERIVFIRQAIVSKVRISFTKILRESKSKTEVIVNFLAVLELAKQKEIVFNQDGLFGEIFVETYKSLEENLN